MICFCLKSIYHSSLYHYRMKSELWFENWFQCVGQFCGPPKQLVKVCGLRACSEFSEFPARVFGVSRLDGDSRPFSGIVSGLGLSMALCDLDEWRSIVEFRILILNYSPVSLGLRGHDATIPFYRFNVVANKHLLI